MSDMLVAIMLDGKKRTAAAPAGVVAPEQGS
jgi:hypothetical protein